MTHLNILMLNEYKIQSLYLHALGTLAFTKYQPYIWQALNQARAINPSIKIVVILSRAALKGAIVEKLVSLNVTVEINEELALGNQIVNDFHRAFFVQGDLEPDGNREFVQFTLERLLSIYTYMEKNMQAHVFHLENDNMLYVDLRILGERMDHCGVRLAVPRAAEDQAVLSFIYVRDVHSLERLIKWCIAVFHLGRDDAMKFLNTSYINDMTLTARYLKLRGATIEQSKRSGVYELPTQFLSQLHDCCLCFLGGGPIIFDACVLGQYFGGTYPNPNDSYWQSDRLVDPRGDRLSWKSHNQQMKVPYIRTQRIANIHVHSKHLQRFSSFGNQQITDLNTLHN